MRVVPPCPLLLPLLAVAGSLVIDALAVVESCAGTDRRHIS